MHTLHNSNTFLREVYIIYKCRCKTLFKHENLHRYLVVTGVYLNCFCLFLIFVVSYLTQVFTKRKTQSTLQAPFIDEVTNRHKSVPVPVFWFIFQFHAICHISASHEIGSRRRAGSRVYFNCTGRTCSTLDNKQSLVGLYKRTPHVPGCTRVNC